MFIPRCTLELKILSFALVAMLFVFHMGLDVANACRAFYPLALMSSSVLPVRLIMLPKYRKPSTSVTAFSETVTGFSCWFFMRSNLVFLWLILRSTFCAGVSGLFTFFCMLADGATIKPSRQRAHGFLAST